MLKIINITILIIIFSSNILFAQEYSTDNIKAIKYFEKALEQFNKKEYSKSLKFCDKAIEKADDFVEPYLLIGQIYYNLEQYTLEIEYLQKVIKIDSTRKEIFYIIASDYFLLKDYENAQNYYEKALTYKDISDKNKITALHRIEICKFRIYAVKNPVSFNPIKLPSNINTAYDEYFPVLSPDENSLFFTRRHFLFSDKLQEDIFISVKKDTSWSVAQNISSRINTNENEGAHTITSDGKTLIFTRCSKTSSCDLYISNFQNNIWSIPVRLPNFVNSKYWDSQPSISADGNTIFFVSNRPGGKGQMDIWKISRESDGKWSKPTNLGDSINTTGNEMSPFIHHDNKTLYFSSDYWAGMEGFDLFISRKDSNNIWSKPKNLGYPINTNANERRIIVNTKGNIAFFSSNRDNKQQDIYQFNIFKEIQPERTIYVKGNIFDSKTRKKILSEYEITNIDNKKVVFHDSTKSEFIICLPINQNYALNVSKEKYLFYSENFSLYNLPDTINYYNLKILLIPINTGEKIILKNIFFNTNSYKLLSKSYVELNKLVRFLNINKEIRIEIGGHTDNVGTTAHNKLLSENRAKSVFIYLTKNGINKSRIIYRGYGYSQPIDTNNTKEGRAKNRRTEIKIIE